ncbi:MAG TPA: MraY family glycosyltransferase [Chitinophagaceae bacterium]|nr:MraY family glycosyltransferase [Chitinophagaceae bacterium]
MIQVAAAIIIAYLVTFFLMPFIIKMARQSRIYDVPDERKTHTYLISSLGGIGLFAGLALSLLLTSDLKSNNAEFQYHLAAFFVIFTIGVVDDIFVLRAWKKLVGQLVTATIIIVKGHLVISSLAGFMGVYQLSPLAGYIISFFVIMLVINAFNLIDGIDGLAASLGLVSSVIFSLFFLINQNYPYAILGFALAGALLAFLVFNFHPAKIFMGDSGSMLIGLVNAILFLKFINTGSVVTDYPVKAAPLVGFGILIIPLMDVLRVFCIRLAKGKSPFSPDRNHIHHLLLNKGCSHAQATLLLLGSSLVFAGVSFIYMGININALLAVQSIMFFVGFFLVYYFGSRKKYLRVVSRRSEKAGAANSVQVFSLFHENEKSVVKEE